MAYETYTTEAIVCGSYDRNGADKQFRLLTKDSGMLYVTARSVREERSKQRFALQDFSQVQVSLVNGKSGWRIGSVEANDNHFLSAPDRATRAFVVGAIKIMNQFLQGEEPHEHIYTECVKFLKFTQEEFEGDRTHVLLVFEVRLLEELGYVQVTKLTKPLFVPDTSYQSLLSNLSPEQCAEIEQMLVRGREASHL